jgi:hypothetical protein
VRRAARLLSCLLLLGGLVQSCSKPNSVLLVNVVDDSGALTAVTQLKVRVLVGTAVSQFSVPMAAGGPITFPTSFTVEIDRSTSGAVNVNVTAMSGSKTVSGTANLGMLNVGNENVVTVHLGFPPPPDAGVDSGGIDAGVDAAADGGADAPSDTGARDVGSDVSTDLGGDVPHDGNGTGGAGAGGSGTGGMGMGGMGTGGAGMGGMGTGGAGMGGMGIGGAGMGGSGVGGDIGVGGDMGTGGATGSDAGDAGDAGDASDASDADDSSTI